VQTFGLARDEAVSLAEAVAAGM
ncbi:MAG: hypothetical protein JWQ65_95, partial [Devosia sp.]|nr:hypothetical protein [Devosia sp.]